MGTVTRLFDRLTNIMSGMGTTADKRAASFYAFMPISAAEAEAAYRSSWLVRKIVDIPPFDMTREWRDWQTDKDTIQKLEAEEKRLQLRMKCQRALVLARLYGGGAIILGTNDPNPMEPLDPARIGVGDLKYIHVVSRWQLAVEEAILDPTSPWFMQPSFFSMTGGNGQQAKIHPSRVVSFVGQRAPEGSMMPNANGSWYWGDPIMQSIGDAVKNADTAQNGFASLIDEAKIDVIGIPDLMSVWSTAEHETQLMARLNAAAQGKSTYRALIKDAQETWEQKQVTWSGMDNMLLAYLDMVAGAADIPLTRLLGQSPRGLQSTGDGEARDYHSMVKARQSELLTPALDQIDELLIRSALGDMPSDIYYEFGSLDDTDEKDEATIEFNFAQALKNYSDTGIFPDDFLMKIAANRIIESGRWPGSEAAFEEAEANAAANPEPDADETQLQTMEQRVAALEQAGTITKPQADALLKDAAPRSLYVSRKLLNAAAVIDWAKGQGFETTVPADQMHVTVLYSRTPVDWMDMGSDWSGDDKGQLRVAPGGPRMLDRFGSMGDAAVLLFNSSALCWRHEDMIGKGATSDYPDFCPHVTLSYDVPAGFDLSAVEPYQGELVFGPEIFAEVQDDWKSTIEEE